MIKFLLALFLLFTASISVVRAESDLQTYSDNSYSIQTRNFSEGSVVYIKINANSPGTKKHQLNLRDNSYNIISSVNLSNTGGNNFTGSIKLPDSSGTYSLEAQIESEGSVSKSAKTVQVGLGSSSSNVKISVNANSSNSSSTSQSSNIQSSPGISATPITTPTPSASSELSQQSSPFADNNSEEQDSEGIIKKIENFIKNIFENLF